MAKSIAILFAAVPATVLALGATFAIAGTHEEVGAIVCVTDKWDEKEPEKGHKLVDYAGRCVKVPDNSAGAKLSEACVGKYEFLADGTWKASGTCVATQKPGDTISSAWEEGSHLKVNPYTVTGCTGKFQSVSGSGTYQYDQLTETLYGGRYSGTLELP
jgi:hypothetical protein